MAKVQALTSVKVDGIRYNEGDELDVSEARAKELVEAGLVEKPKASTTTTKATK